MNFLHRTKSINMYILLYCLREPIYNPIDFIFCDYYVYSHNLNV